MTAAAMTPRTSTERITVGLIRKSSEDLAVLAAETGMSKTDLVNRALAVYKLVHDKAQAGMQLGFIAPSELGEPEFIEVVHLV